MVAPTVYFLMFTKGIYETAQLDKQTYVHTEESMFAESTPCNLFIYCILDK